MVDLCHGCGVDVTGGKNERRLLSTSKSEHVLKVWKALLGSLDLDLGDEPLGYMCRSCFSAYERLMSLQNNIGEKLNKAIELQYSPQGGSSKRIRLETSQRVLFQRPPAASSSTSPDVGVKPVTTRAQRTHTPRCCKVNCFLTAEPTNYLHRSQ